MSQNIRVISKKNKKAWKIFMEFGIFEKYANEAQDSIYATSEQYAIGYLIQELDELKTKVTHM